MFNVAEAKNTTEEIAELLKTATQEEKLQIKGILIGAKITSDKLEKEDEAG